MHRNFADVPKHVAIAHFCNQVQNHGIQTDQQIIKIATTTIVNLHARQKVFYQPYNDFVIIIWHTIESNFEQLK